MEKEFVTYEIGLELKQLGFDESCFAYYEDGVFIHWYDSKQENELLLNCTAPTYSQAFRWFREKYKLHSSVDFDQLKEKDDEDIELYHFTINEQWTVGKDWYDYKYGFKNHTFCRNFNTYEKAELACLKKLIEIVKTK
jgi:hypothetical protein